jgi:hypothetical protein
LVRSQPPSEIEISPLLICSSIREEIASTLNLSVIDNGSKTTFIDDTGLKFFINGFYVDIKLELTVTT